MYFLFVIHTHFFFFFFQTAWSDSEDVLSNFNEVQELCDSNKAKSITDLLNVAHKAVEKVR